MTRAVDAGIGCPRLHSECVEQPVVVVWIPFAGVNGGVELVRALHQLQALNGKRDRCLAFEAARIHLLDERVGAVAAHAIGVEQTYAERKVGCRRVAAALQPTRPRPAALTTDPRP